MAIWKGADNGSQMGVFYQIQETEAVTNIQIRSAEYMPANLRARSVSDSCRVLYRESTRARWLRLRSVAASAVCGDGNGQSQTHLPSQVSAARELI